MTSNEQNRETVVRANQNVSQEPIFFSDIGVDGSTIQDAHITWDHEDDQASEEFEVKPTFKSDKKRSGRDH